MRSLCEKFLKSVNDKSLITLLSILVSVKCLVYCIISGIEPDKLMGFWGESFIVAVASVGVCDLWLCMQFIFSYFKEDWKSEQFSSRETKKAVENSDFLLGLVNGNIVSAGIFSFDYVTEIEKKLDKTEEVWSVSGDLDIDSTNEKLKEIIHNNLGRGVTYRYFTTHEKTELSNKRVAVGRRALEEANKKYLDKLYFVTVEEELIAPDIDIILYNARTSDKRMGFVCVEIGENENTYVYQQLDDYIVQGIYEQLANYIENKEEVTCDSVRKMNKFMHFLGKNFAYVWFVTVAIVLIALNINTEVSIKSTVLFVFLAVAEVLITLALMQKIDDNNDEIKEFIDVLERDEKTLSRLINREEFKDVFTQITNDNLKELEKQKDMITAGKMLNLDKNTSKIWILSNLSNDIGNQTFLKRLKEVLKQYDKIPCCIIHTTGTTAIGWENKILELSSEFGERIINRSINEDNAKHYIWSETYGIVFLENKDKSHDVYVSLKGEDNPFYKKVYTKEEDAATILGRLKKLSDQSRQHLLVSKL